MISWGSLPDAEFRLTLSGWLKANYPPQWRKDALRPFRRLRGGDLTAWLRQLQKDGLRAPAWPIEHGGMGLSFARQRVYQEEMERAQVARVIDFGEQMLGPVLMAYGTEAQKRTLLPRILSCEDIWCQGYSEPGAGSDLAALTTRAQLEDDRFVVTGQKLWTTHAQDATHMFALVRTDPNARKQAGISFLLLDLASPGVTVRPVANIAGEEEYCEVFLEAVEAPLQALVGELNQGWAVAKALLSHERIWVGSPALCRDAMGLALRTASAIGCDQDAAVRDELADLACTLHDYEALYSGFCEKAEIEGAIGPEVGVLKVIATELQQRICETITEMAEGLAGIVGPARVADLVLDVHWQLMMSRPITIFGGANAVQRDLLAATLLGLPRE